MQFPRIASTMSRLSAVGVVFWTALVLGSVMQAVLVGLAIFFASTHALLDTSIHSVALAASVLDALALVALLVVGLCHLRGLLPGLLSFLGAASGHGVAAVLTIYTFASAGHSDQAGGDDDLVSTSEAGIAIWTLAAICHLTFYAIILSARQPREGLPPPETARPTSARSMKRSLSVHLTSVARTPPSRPWRPSSAAELPPSCAYASPSTTATTPSPSPRSSLRQSLLTPLRPTTSLTRLLRHPSSATSFTAPRNTSLDTPRRTSDSDFEFWDTSAALQDPHSAQNQQPHLYRRFSPPPTSRLPPIPGSRPVSPTRPLNGPFSPTAAETPLPPSPEPTFGSPPTTPPRALCSPASSPTFAGFHPGERAARSSPGASLRAVERESHIHPLFRAASPVPAPVASLGTMITGRAARGREGMGIGEGEGV